MSSLHITDECIAFLARETDNKRDNKFRVGTDKMACGLDSDYRHINSGFFNIDREYKDPDKCRLVSCPDCIKKMKEKGL